MLVTMFLLGLTGVAMYFYWFSDSSAEPTSDLPQTEVSTEIASLSEESVLPNDTPVTIQTPLISTPTNTPIPTPTPTPRKTNTPVPTPTPTNTFIPPTNTPVGTATPALATATPLPPVAIIFPEKGAVVTRGATVEIIAQVNFDTTEYIKFDIFTFSPVRPSIEYLVDTRMPATYPQPIARWDTSVFNTDDGKGWTGAGLEIRLVKADGNYIKAEYTYVYLQD